MWVSKTDFEELTGKAKSYDSIVASILKSNEAMKAEDVTLDSIQAAISASENVKSDDLLSEKVTDLEAKVETLTTEVSTVTTDRDDLKSEIETLKSENEKLRDLPGAESVVTTTAKPKSEASAIIESESLAYAKANKDDFAGIAAKLKEEGLV